MKQDFKGHEEKKTRYGEIKTFNIKLLIEVIIQMQIQIHILHTTAY